jgi:hypothetical protein
MYKSDMLHSLTKEFTFSPEILADLCTSGTIPSLLIFHVLFLCINCIISTPFLLCVLPFYFIVSSFRVF